MTSWTRRQFLFSTAVLAAAAHGCSFRRPSQREAALAELARGIAVPDTRAILAKSEALAAALHGDLAQLEQARRALREAALAWQHAYAFRNGPIIESRAFIRASFWPIRQDAVRGLLAGSQPLDAKLVAELGVDLKGVFALEHLLFEGPAPGGEVWLLGPARERARAFALALSDDITAYAGKALRSLADGSDFAARFAQAGQESVNLLVNQMVGTLETAAARRVDHVLATHRNQTLRLKDVQGGACGLSSDIPRTWLATTERIYLGLSQLVVAAAPRIDAALREAFSVATAKLAAIRSPLEQAVAQDPQALAEAVTALKALEMAMRVDLVSALGVTLTFTASDGD